MSLFAFVVGICWAVSLFAFVVGLVGRCRCLRLLLRLLLCLLVGVVVCVCCWVYCSVSLFALVIWNYYSVSLLVHVVGFIRWYRCLCLLSDLLGGAGVSAVGTILLQSLGCNEGKARNATLGKHVHKK